MKARVFLAPAVVLGTLVGLAALALSYGVIFSFYVSGFFGEGQAATPALWQKVLERTLLLSPFLAAFVVLAVVARRNGWPSGILPWGAGAAAVILLARRDAGILGPADPYLLGLALLFAWRLAAPRGRHGDV